MKIVFVKITKNVISQKLQQLEQTPLEAKFANPSDSPKLQGYEFQILKKKIVKFSEKIVKNHKNVISRNSKGFEKSYLEADSQLKRVPLQHSTTE